MKIKNFCFFKNGSFQDRFLCYFFLIIQKKTDRNYILANICFFGSPVSFDPVVPLSLFVFPVLNGG